MMVPTYFDDFLGTSLTDPEIQHVTIQNVERHHPQELHFSKSTLQLLLNPVFMGVGEVLRLLKEQGFGFNEKSLKVETKCDCADNQYKLEVSWDYPDMSADHYNSFNSLIRSLTIKDVELTTGQSASRINVTFKSQLL